ncbi:hypothetical protein CCUS01_15961 [Colletotrichum cuscutae]|uniref:Uncharacterized protein n=1 Tax=Colletotrichum cuscutae TaxID=1209917 RepID=A0AAI9VHG0_9PEZI|nr:hypothetical protein CCUS01_15961 [Colletotrichum cuscutae]
MTVFWYYQPFAGSSSDGVNLERARRFGDTIEQNKPTAVTVDYLQRSRFRAPQMVQRLLYRLQTFHPRFLQLASAVRQRFRSQLRTVCHVCLPKQSLHFGVGHARLGHCQDLNREPGAVAAGLWELLSMMLVLLGKKLLAAVEPGGQHRGSEAADILRNKSAVGTRIKTHDPNKDPEL